RDSVLALPVAVTASAIALLWARVLGLRSSIVDLFARGALAALLFGLLLVPSAPIHNQIDAATGATYSLPATAILTAATDEHAGHLGAAPDPGLFQLETDQSLTGQMVHGAHDALLGQVVALPLGALGLLLLAPGGLRRLRRRRRPAAELHPSRAARNEAGRRLTP